MNSRQTDPVLGLVLLFCLLQITKELPFLASSARPRFWSRRATAKKNQMSTSEVSNTVGGGAVNEKKRVYGEQIKQEINDSCHDATTPLSSAYDPMQHRSHLLHAIEGLNRYPNYLSRWGEDDMERLEEALQDRLNQVREQRSKVIDQRVEIKQLLQDFLETNSSWNGFVNMPVTWESIRSSVLDPRAATAIFRAKVFQPKNSSISVDDVLSGRVPVEVDAAYLEELMDEEMFDIYSFPLLSPDFCHKLHQFVSAFMNFLETTKQQSVGRSIHKDLDNLGMGWLNDLLFHLVVRPICLHLYKETELEGGDLDWRQGFIASYSADPTQSKPRQRLVPHTDDAEVTLNVCLGDQFDGGNLHFWGLRGENVAGNKMLGEYQPEVGRAVIHSGRHLHEVTPITSGDRFALIQWTRSWNSTRKERCPCCWLNRRRGSERAFGNSCICGPRWN